MFSQHGLWPTLELDSDPGSRWVQWLSPILDRLYSVSLSLAPAAIALYILSYLKRLSQFPPGPWPLPVIGNFLQIDTANPHRSFVKWQEKYGPIYTVWLPKPVVVIADFDELQRVFRENNDANDRPMSFLYGIFTRHQTDGDGIILSQGERWRCQRGFALQAFRSLGMGRSRAEAIINHHKNELLTRLDGYCQQGLEKVSDVHFLLAFCFGNVIQDFVMGRHYNYNHPEFLWLKECIDKTLKGVASVWMLIVDSYPWMRFFIPAYWRYKKHGFELQQFFLEEIGRHIQNFDATAEPDNFIDAYLRDMHEQNDVNLTDLPLNSPKLLTLALNAGDLWTGGLETVVTTLTWSVLYLIHYPRVQTRLQAELDETLQSRPFSVGDRRNLHYLRATVDELQRIVNVLPWHIPHAVEKETTLRGTRLAAGTTIMPQYGAVHFNERYFPDPETFRPERFLDQNNQYSDLLSRRLNPFGMGRRACLGEGLARMELFIVFASLVQNFHFEPVDPENLPSLDRVAGMTSTCKPFTCRVKRRHPENPLILS